MIQPDRATVEEALRTLNIEDTRQFGSTTET